MAKKRKEKKTTLACFAWSLDCLLFSSMDNHRPIHRNNLQPWLITNSLHAVLLWQINKSLNVQLERVSFKSHLHMQHTHQSDLRTDEHVRHPCSLAMDRCPSGNHWGGVCTDATVPSPTCASADSSLRNAETPTATDQSQLLSQHVSTVLPARCIKSCSTTVISSLLTMLANVHVPEEMFFFFHVNSL